RQVDLLVLEQSLAAAQEARPRPATASVDLVALHRQDDLGAAGIAGDDLERQIEQLAQHVGEDVAFGATAGGADPGRLGPHVLPGADTGRLDEGADADLA